MHSWKLTIWTLPQRYDGRTVTMKKGFCDLKALALSIVSSSFNIQLFLLLKSLNFQASLTGRPSSATFFCRIISQTAVRFRSSISSTPMSWYWNDMKISSHAHAINTKNTNKFNQFLTIQRRAVYTFTSLENGNFKGNFNAINQLKDTNITYFQFQVIVLGKCLPTTAKFGPCSCMRFPKSDLNGPISLIRTQRMISLFVFLRYLLAKLDDIL